MSVELSSLHGQHAGYQRQTGHYNALCIVVTPLEMSIPHPPVSSSRLTPWLYSPSLLSAIPALAQQRIYSLRDQGLNKRCLLHCKLHPCNAREEEIMILEPCRLIEPASTVELL